MIDNCKLDSIVSEYKIYLNVRKLIDNDIVYMDNNPQIINDTKSESYKRIVRNTEDYKYRKEQIVKLCPDIIDGKSEYRMLLHMINNYIYSDNDRLLSNLQTEKHNFDVGLYQNMIGLNYKCACKQEINKYIKKLRAGNNVELTEQPKQKCNKKINNNDNYDVLNVVSESE